MSPQFQEALQLGMVEGEATITAAAATLKVAEVIGTREYLKSDYLKRAVAAKVGHNSNAKEEALYPLYLTDAEGQSLDGREADYVMRFGPDDLPPVNAFWSLTCYDSGNQALVPNPMDRYRISSSMLPTLTRDADGNLTLHLQNGRPQEEQTSNWLPIPPGPFYLVMRLYWPKPESYDGKWTPPLIWKTNEAPTAAPLKPAGAEAAEEVKAPVLVEEPKPEMERPTVWGEPTEVQILIYVIDVDEINSADQSFAASVFFEARWKNPFLRHQGPGPLLRRPNRRLESAIDHCQSTDGVDFLSRIGRDSAGRDGRVSPKSLGTIFATLKSRDFPFDSQRLSIQLVAAGLLEEHVNMVPLTNATGSSSRIANSFSLPDFTVVSWNAAPAPYYRCSRNRRCRRL